MSIKKKLPLLFSLIVLAILISNNSLHYIRTKQKLVDFNEREMALITEELSHQVENAKEGALYVEDILAKELRTASIAIQKSLPPNYEDVTNEQLIALSQQLMVSHITLLAKTEDDIIGVRSSDHHEIDMSTKEWGYWYTAMQELFELRPVSVDQGLTLAHYWSGPIEVASSNPNHIDKWGYYYDGSTNYIIDPYFRDDKVLEYEQRFGPGKVINRFQNNLEGVLELSVFNPKNFGQEKELIHLNGNSFIRLSDKPIWYGDYYYSNENVDAKHIQKAITTGEKQHYIEKINGKLVRKTFVPVLNTNAEPFVIGLSYDYGLFQKQLQKEQTEHIILSIVIMLIVLGTSLIFSHSITKPISLIVEHVNEIARGKFGNRLTLNRRDELGVLTNNVNALSHNLQTYMDDLRKSQEVIEYQAYHDPLTSLPNRRFIQEKLTEMMTYPKRLGEFVAVLFIDIDRFKHINDSLGHIKGDELIKLIASRIQQTLPKENSVVARQGGDEFIILLDHVSKDESLEIARRVVANLRKVFTIQELELYVGASCGVSLYPEHTTEMDSLIACADMAMYAAKNEGGNKVYLYTDALSMKNKKRPQMEALLRRAIKKESIEVYYQPKMNVHTKKIIGAEALVRWNDEVLGFVSPAEFIPMAEETGLIQPLWDLVTRKACLQMKNWNEMTNESFSIAVNFSAKQFQDPKNMVKRVKEILKDTELLPKFFEIEITESILLYNTEETISALRELKEYGVYISIDDFGTGYSSLNYLKSFPIDCLKIDQSFIRDISSRHEHTEIPNAIINLAKSLKLDVIAEGVEEPYQKEYLLNNNCFMMQGYLFSKPLSVSDFTNFIAKRS
ncbi:EAL domain-containing protein [Bacillus timonensis]|nr:EAL domain-containing protein [Bacillus timonensis]